MQIIYYKFNLYREHIVICKMVSLENWALKLPVIMFGK